MFLPKIESTTIELMHIKTLLSLGRVSNLPTVWMNAIAAIALSSAAAGLEVGVLQVLAILVGLSCLYAGGMSFNDYCDRHWDLKNQAFRPIPAGKISAQKVLVISIGLFILGLVFLFQTAASFAAAIGLLSLIIAYDILHKQFASSVLLMASTRLGVYIVAAFAFSSSPPSAVFILALIQAIYTLAVTLVARYENKLGFRFCYPLIPWLLAGMGIVDGVVLSFLLSPIWILAGVGTTALTRFFQLCIRGD